MNKMLSREELVTLRLETMKRHEALNLAIAYLASRTLVDCEVARKLLIIMRDEELRREKHDDLIKASMPPM